MKKCIYFLKSTNNSKKSTQIQFKRRNWLEQYISFNTKYRIIVKNELEMIMCTFLNNSAFRKKTQNKKKQRK